MNDKEEKLKRLLKALFTEDELREILMKKRRVIINNTLKVAQDSKGRAKEELSKNG